jgi:gp16 family phage-associated protein
MTKRSTKLRTRGAVQAEFRRLGRSIRSWALSVGVDPVIAAHVVAGRCQGHFGEAHRVAVLLRIKSGQLAPRPKQEKR